MMISMAHISVVTYAESDNHNMSQMMQRGNVVMGFDQTKISHEFSPTKIGGR